MDEEIEAIKATLDTLIARSIAQEAVLSFLIAQQNLPFLDVDFEPFSRDTMDKLRTSPLTDIQLAHVSEELKRWHQRLST